MSFSLSLQQSSRLSFMIYYSTITKLAVASLRWARPSEINCNPSVTFVDTARNEPKIGPGGVLEASGERLGASWKPLGSLQIIQFPFWTPFGGSLFMLWPRKEAPEQPKMVSKKGYNFEYRQEYIFPSIWSQKLRPLGSPKGLFFREGGFSEF